jgi:hypothetical protein
MREHTAIRNAPEAEWLEPPIVKAAREMLEALAQSVRDSENPYTVALAASGAANILKEVRKLLESPAFAPITFAKAPDGPQTDPPPSLEGGSWLYDSYPGPLPRSGPPLP